MQSFVASFLSDDEGRFIADVEAVEIQADGGRAFAEPLFLCPTTSVCRTESLAEAILMWSRQSPQDAHSNLANYRPIASVMERGHGPVLGNREHERVRNRLGIEQR